MKYTGTDLMCIVYMMYVLEGPLVVVQETRLHHNTMVDGLFLLRGHYAYDPT